MIIIHLTGWSDRVLKAYLLFCNTKSCVQKFLFTEAEVVKAYSDFLLTTFLVHMSVSPTLKISTGANRSFQQQRRGTTGTPLNTAPDMYILADQIGPLGGNHLRLAASPL